MQLRTLYTGLVVVLTLTIASPALAATPSTIGSSNTEARVHQLENRLAEIKSMDTKTLSRADKKTLRREVREIKKELAAISGGVYLSVGAIILIALLLILLL